MASSTLTVDDEILAISDFMGISRESVRQILVEFSRQASTYTEIAINRTNLEVITGGSAGGVRDHLLRIAGRLQAPAALTNAFELVTNTFPNGFFGIKAGVQSQPATPSLYIRLLQPIEDALDVLARIPTLNVGSGLAALENELSATRTMYGLAFYTLAGSLGVKTYTIADVQKEPGNDFTGTTPGFISHRLDKTGLHTTTKYYLPEVNLLLVSSLDAHWDRLLGFLHTELGYQTAGHLAWSLIDGEPANYKLYFERIGALATDFSQR